MRAMPGTDRPHGGLLQRRGVSSEVEHSAFNRLVVGSIPTRPTISLAFARQIDFR